MNNIKLPTIVLFDMDGTTVRHIHPWLLNILEFIDDIIYKFSRFVARLRRGREMIDFSDEPAPKKRLLAHKALHKIRRKEVDEIVQPCPGIFPLLNLFKKNNIPVGLVSNGLGEGYGHEVLETFGLDDYFDTTIFREDASKSKPHPDSLLRALKNIKEEPNEEDVIWYIGDRQKDVEAAIAARKFVDCTFQPFGYGLNATVAILRHNVGADHIIMDYTDFALRVAEMFEDNKGSNTKTKPHRKASKSAS